MEKLECVECGREIEDCETNYGTPDYACCIQCWSEIMECRYDLECKFVTKIEEKANVNKG